MDNQNRTSTAALSQKTLQWHSRFKPWNQAIQCQKSHLSTNNTSIPLESGNQKKIRQKPLHPKSQYRARIEREPPEGANLTWWIGGYIESPHPGHSSNSCTLFTGLIICGAGTPLPSPWGFRKESGIRATSSSSVIPSDTDMHSMLSGSIDPTAEDNKQYKRLQPLRNNSPLLLSSPPLEIATFLSF